MSGFHSVMSLIKEKPGLFLGKKSFTMLHGFITGYFYAEYDYKLLKEHSTLFPLPFDFFHEFVRIKLGYYESTSGWFHMIFENNNHDEERSFDVFFQLYDEFMDLKTENCSSAMLTAENKHFHIHNPFTPKRVTDYDEHGNLLYVPYFSDPEQIFIIGISNNLGYLRVVIAKKECFLVSNLADHNKKPTEYFHKCFGENLCWSEEEWKDEILHDRKIALASSI
jgi:hypothetical protein